MTLRGVWGIIGFQIYVVMVTYIEHKTPELMHGYVCMASHIGMRALNAGTYCLWTNFTNSILDYDIIEAERNNFLHM